MNGHFVFLDFGFFQIYWFGFLSGCAILTASLIYCLLRKVQGEEFSEALLTVLLAIPSAFVFSRVSYCWFRSASFSGRMIEYLRLNDGGYALHGAFLGVLLVLLLRAILCRKNTVMMLDAAAPALSSAVVIGRFAGITGSEETGVEVETSLHLPFLVWSEADQGNVLWVGFFEGCFAAIVAVLTLVLFLKKYREHSPGLREGCVVLCFMLTYGLSQAILESMRGDSFYMVTLGFVRIDQILCILMAILSIVLVSVDYVKVKGISSSLLIKWFFCAASLAVAVTCEFTLNATYLVMIYCFMFCSLAAMWMITATLFYSTVQARSNEVSADRHQKAVSEERIPPENHEEVSIESMNHSSIESLIQALNESVSAKQ